MGQEKIVANLVTTRAYDLECHMFTSTEREMPPTCPKVPGCKKTTRLIFLWFRNVDIMMNNKYTWRKSKQQYFSQHKGCKYKLKNLTSFKPFFDLHKVIQRKHFIYF